MSRSTGLQSDYNVCSDIRVGGVTMNRRYFLQAAATMAASTAMGQMAKAEPVRYPDSRVETLEGRNSEIVESGNDLIRSSKVA